MTYKSAAAVEMAVKSAASASSLDTARAVSSFYFHRLLCRVFAGNNKKFVLKGGEAMPDKFSVPREWGLFQGRQFEKLSANTGLPAGLKVIYAAAELAGNLIDPAINASVSGLQWFPEDLKWECKDS